MVLTFRRMYSELMSTRDGGESAPTDSSICQRISSSSFQIGNGEALTNVNRIQILEPVRSVVSPEQVHLARNHNGSMECPAAWDVPGRADFTPGVCDCAIHQAGRKKQLALTRRRQFESASIKLTQI